MKPRIATAEDLKRLRKRERGNKYRNRKVIVDGIKFDSSREAQRYSELKILQQAGQIRNLKLQPKYALYAGIKYVADFEYEFPVRNYTTKKLVAWWTRVEDVKGVQTQAFKMKAKMFREKYGFEITVVK